MKAVLYGASGHARVVLDAARSTGAFDVVAVVDDRADLLGTLFEGIQVIGDRSAFSAARDRGARVLLLGIGTVDVGDPRRDIYDRVLPLGFELPSVVHRTAVIAPSAKVGAA
jgi:FlaA1/EpsC-like NDP-sugar epimerase